MVYTIRLLISLHNGWYQFIPMKTTQLKIANFLGKNNPVFSQNNPIFSCIFPIIPKNGQTCSEILSTIFPFFPKMWDFVFLKTGKFSHCGIIFPTFLKISQNGISSFSWIISYFPKNSHYNFPVLSTGGENFFPFGIFFLLFPKISQNRISLFSWIIPYFPKNSHYNFPILSTGGENNFPFGIFFLLFPKISQNRISMISWIIPYFLNIS